MVRMQEKPKKTNSGHERCLREHEGGNGKTSEEGIGENSNANILGVCQGPGRAPKGEVTEPQALDRSTYCR